MFSTPDHQISSKVNHQYIFQMFRTILTKSVLSISRSYINILQSNSISILNPCLISIIKQLNLKFNGRPRSELELKFWYFREVVKNWDSYHSTLSILLTGIVSECGFTSLLCEKKFEWINRMNFMSFFCFYISFMIFLFHLMLNGTIIS